MIQMIQPVRSAASRSGRKCLALASIAAAAVLFAGAVSGQATRPGGGAASAPAQASAGNPVPFKPVAHVEKLGDGPVPMILIPGFCCDWAVFESFMQRNASRYTMYAVTLPGFGGTQPPEFPPQDTYDYWLDNAAQAVWKVVEENHLEKPVIAGHSLGGHVAFRVGVAHSDAIRAVVAIDGTPAFFFGEDMTGAQRILAAEAQRTKYDQHTESEWADSQRKFFQNAVSDPGRGMDLANKAVRTPQSVAVQYLLELFVADLRPELPKLTAPVLVIPSIPPAEALGEVEPEAIKKQWRDTLKSAPRATLAFFENTRHFIQDDRPEELDQAIDDFLNGREVKGVSPQTPLPGAAPVPAGNGSPSTAPADARP